MDVKHQDSIFDVAHFSRVFTLSFIFASIAAILLGIASSFSSPVRDSLVLKLQNQENLEDELKMTIDQFKIFVGIFSIGAMFGSLFSTSIAETAGRRGGMMIGAFVFMASVFCFTFTTDPHVAYFGRFLQGLGVGVAFSSANIYISEISPSRFRASITSSLQVFVNFGQFLVNIIALYVTRLPKTAADADGHCDFKLLSWLLLIPSGLLFISMYIFCPESPMWLARHNRNSVEAVKRARETLIRLRGSVDYVDVRDMEKLKKIAGESAYINHQSTGFGNHVFSLKESILGSFSKLIRLLKMYKKQLFCAVGILFFRLAIGLNLLNFYTEQIFSIIFKNQERTHVWTSLFLAFGVIAACFSPLILNNFGRKSVYIFCCFVYAFGYFITAFGMFYPEYLSFSVVGLFLSYAAFSIGCGPVPYVIPPEILPVEARSTGVGAGYAMLWLASFSVGTTLPDLERIFGGVSEEGVHRGLGFVFIFYGSIAVSAALFVYMFIPETKGGT